MEDADINMEEAFACLKFARSSPMQVIHTMSPSDVLLSDELWASVASFLSLATLKLARLVSKRFNQICSRDEAGWKQHRDRLWSRRFHVSVDEYRLCSAMEAYMKSCADARLRHTVRLKELIYDPQSDSAIVWSFRFKEVAGTQWTQSDPWYQGRQARQFAFLENGHVKQRLAGPAKPNGVELKQPFFDAPNLPGGLDIRWRFVAQPIDFPRKEMGAYIRLTIAGRDVPTYLVHRSVSGNWGFLMENCWGVFASFPLPRKVPAQPITRPPRMRLRRDTNGGARWIDVSTTESDDEDENYMVSVSKLHLLEDTSLSVSCRWQWREALLYNLGATVLPDGPNATADFDRTWQLSMRSLQSFGFPSRGAALNQPPGAGMPP